MQVQAKRYLIVVAIIGLVYSLFFGFMLKAFGHEAGHPELNSWFEGLKSERGGACCSHSDATTLSDVDWEGQDKIFGGPGNNTRSHYRVRIEGQWIDVPDTALVEGPNLSGHTLVWPIKGYLGISIRCFMPGPMT